MDWVNGSAMNAAVLSESLEMAHLRPQSEAAILTEPDIPKAPGTSLPDPLRTSSVKVSSQEIYTNLRAYFGFDSFRRLQSHAVFATVNIPLSGLLQGHPGRPP
ncbi:hypothetical protein [Microvirga puerhi]|uniref:Uncharacterized protein n=1 Tax=Microvirga puerhi TaxID=2876078 RepID=A0ABS7VU04_9HYPH|nr:hypothetical protein [Microvirga puerhi]MBZ6079063.1 hypothetical protein [Microvirga puerhi]